MAGNHKKVIVCAIAAMDEARVIGVKNGLPWKLPEDMKRFAELTRGHTVLMGRKTFDSLPAKFKPLPDRKNIVVSRKPDEVLKHEAVEAISSPQSFIQECLSGKRNLISNRLWIIGGEQIYLTTQPYWEEVYLTFVEGEHEGDAFLPRFEDSFAEIERDQREGFSFILYRKR